MPGSVSAKPSRLRMWCSVWTVYPGFVSVCSGTRFIGSTRCGGLKSTPSRWRQRPSGRVRGPRRETLGERQLLGVRGLVGEPREHVLGEGELVEFPAEPRRHRLLQRVAVELRRLVGLDLEHRAALHELALHAEEGREAMVALHQLLPRLLDVEEARHEAVEVGRDRDQQLRLFLVGQRGTGAGGEEPLAQRGVRILQLREEMAIDSLEPLPLVEVLELQVEGEREFLGGGHRGGAAKA